MYDLTFRENDVGKQFPKFLRHSKVSVTRKQKVMEEEKT